MSAIIREGADLTKYWNDSRVVNQVFNGVKIRTPENEKDAKEIKDLIDLAQLHKAYESEYRNDPKAWNECPYFSLSEQQKRCSDRSSYIVLMATVVLGGRETLVGTCCLKSRNTRMVDVNHKEIPELVGVAMHPDHNRTYRVGEKIIGMAHRIAEWLRPADVSSGIPVCFLWCAGMTGIVRDKYCDNYGYTTLHQVKVKDPIFLADPVTNERSNTFYLLAKYPFDEKAAAEDLRSTHLQSTNNGRLGQIYPDIIDCFHGVF